MTSRPFDCVLLDLDGTLTDPFPGISKSVNFALQELGLEPLMDDALRAWIGPPLLHSFADHFSLLGTDFDAQDAVDLYRIRFADVGLFENEIYPGIIPALEELRDARLKLVLATAKPQVYARRILAHFGLDRLLEECYGSELDGTRTNKTELLQYIIDRHQGELRPRAMVGDRHHDIEAARFHRIHAVGVTWGYGSVTELIEAGADVLVDTPAAMLNQLRNCLRF